jgi:hypothetical protein
MADLTTKELLARIFAAFTVGTQKTQVVKSDGSTPALDTVAQAGEAATAASGKATAMKQDAQTALLTTIKSALDTLVARDQSQRKTLDWSGAPWDGVAPKKLQVRTGAGYVKVAALRITAGGGAGGCTQRTAYLCEVGQTTPNATVTTAAVAIATQINAVLDVPRPILADANGEIDVFVVPDVGTTAATLYLDILTV